MLAAAELLNSGGRWPDNVSIWRLDMALASERIGEDKGVAERRVATCYAALDVLERARADGYRVAGERERFVITRASLRAILASQMGVPASSLRFTTVRNGRPALIGYPALSFNVSHAGEHALIAVSHRRVVGIDIEPIDRQVDWIPLVDMVCSAQQRSQLQVVLGTSDAAPRHRNGSRSGIGDGSRSGIGDRAGSGIGGRAGSGIEERIRTEHQNRRGNQTSRVDQRRRFFKCWTAKEAILKALGIGLTDHLSHIDFSLDTEGAQRPRLHSGNDSVSPVNRDRIVTLDNPVIGRVDDPFGQVTDSLMFPLGSEVASLSFHWLTDIVGYMGCIAYSDAGPYAAARTAVR